MTLSNHGDVALIPNELLRPIFENLAGDRKSLCASSLASNAFRQEAQRILFRDVDSDMIESVDFLRTLVASPTRLALFVYAYRADEYISSSDKPIMGQALKAMCNLKHLDMARTLKDEDYRRILLDCTFSLERFDGDTSGQDADEIFASFLPGQTKLKHLGIGCSDNTIRRITNFQCPFAPTNCPQLVSMTGSWTMIKALLPGRMITTLCISSFHDMKTDAAGFEPLELELEYIEALSISNCCTHSVLYYFPCLTILELTSFYFDENMNDIGELDNLCCILSTLPSIQTLVLSGNHMNLDPKEDQDFIREVFEAWIVGKSLTCIDLEIDWGVYTRYTRGLRAREEISEEEVRKVWLAEPI